MSMIKEVIAKYERLNVAYNDLIKEAVGQNKELSKLRAQNEKLVEAVKWYRENSNIANDKDEEPMIRESDGLPYFKVTYGKRARAILTELGITQD